MGRDPLRVPNEVAMERKGWVRDDRMETLRYVKEVSTLVTLAIQVKANDVAKSALAKNCLNDPCFPQGGFENSLVNIEFLVVEQQPDDWSG